ncbi:MAG: Gfo/Idh/MocA family protein [Methanosarcinales archaeon]
MKISVVGYGNIGKIHARIEKKLGYLSNIVEIDDQKRKNALERFNVPIYQDIENMIKNESPDGIIIAVPTVNHFSAVKEIIELKNPSLRAILIEKPIASSLDEAYKLQRLLNESKLKVLVGHSELYNPVIQKLLETLSSQVIGIPKIFFFQRRNNVSNEQLNSLGDVFEDVAIHDFDLFCRIIPDNLLQIQCVGFYYENIINSAVVQIKATQSNILALFLFSREYPGKLRQIEIEGTKGTIFVELLDQYLMYNLRSQIDLQESLQSVSISSGEGQKIKVYGEPLLEEHLEFHSLIKGKKLEPLVKIEDAIKALKLVETCRKSVAFSKSVKINTENL